MISVAAEKTVNNPFFIKNNSLDLIEFVKHLNNNFMILTNKEFSVEELVEYDREELIQYLIETWNKCYDQLRQNIIDKYGISSLINSERNIILSVFDAAWQDHINIMDRLRRSTNLVQYSQKNPYQVYTQLGSKKFKELTDRIALECTINLMNNYDAIPSTNTDVDLSWLTNAFEEKTDMAQTTSKNQQALEFINYLLKSERDHLIKEGLNEQEVDDKLKEVERSILKEFQFQLASLQTNEEKK